MSSELRSGPLGGGVFLLVSLVLGLAPLLAGLDGVGLGPADPQYWWSAAVADGVRAKAERTSGSEQGGVGGRVIFVGGSAVPFGVRARSIEARTGVTVLPVGFNAGLGIDVIAEEAVAIIERGDVVVFTPELQHFGREEMINRTLRSDWLTFRGGGAVEDDVGVFPARYWLAVRGRCRSVFRRMDWEAYGWAVRSLAQRMGNEEMVSFPGVNGYDLRYVDADGNITFPRPRAKDRAHWGSYLVVPAAAAEYDLDGSYGVRTLRRLARECAERGAVLMVMPSFRAVPEWLGEEFREGVRAREDEWMRVAESMGAVRLLEPGETAVEADGAFDSFQHLNERGAAEVEERIVRAILGKVVGR